MRWSEHIREARVLVAVGDKALRGMVVGLLRTAGARVRIARRSLPGWPSLVDHDALVVSAPGPADDPPATPGVVRDALDDSSGRARPFVLVLSDPSTGSDCATALDAGADDFVPLPLRPEEFVARLGRGLGMSRGRPHPAELHRLEFAHMLVHDMRSPVASIRFNAAALAVRVAGEAQDMVADMMRASDVILARLDELLELARDRHLGDPLQADTEEVDVVAMVRAALDRLAGEDRLLHAEGPLDLKLDLGAGQDVIRFRLDPRLFERLLDNLLRNARIHGQRTPIRVRIRCDARGLRLEVADGGPGIPPSHRKQLLRPFQRGEGSAEGFGLGLAFCVRAVDAHHGRLWITTSSEGGASIRIHIPEQRRSP